MTKILIIEDDEILIKMYETKLITEGFIVDKARTGDEALRKLKLNNYDLILLDLALPIIDGFTILKNLRFSNWPSKNKPVLIFSNSDHNLDIRLAKQIGANDYIIKADFNPSQIIKKIKTNINQKNQEGFVSITKLVTKAY